MAEQTTGSIEIEATPKEVMAVITDFESYPEWSDVKTAEVRKRDKQGRGKEVHFDVTSMGLSDSLVFSYTYAPRNGGCSWELVEGKNVRHLEGSYELEAEGDVTHATYRLVVEPAIPLPGLVRRQIEKRIVKTALDGLKKRVEES